MDDNMTDSEKHIGLLFTAELQFRLASAVRLATSLGSQPIDLPVTWTHGNHSVRYGETALRQDQADYAAHFLQRSTTYLLAVVVKDAIRAVVSDPKTSPDSDVRAAYQIARLIRNAFAHAPFSPIWSIDPDCRNMQFEIEGIIRLDTTDLDGKAFDWHHYGGPLALCRLAQFVRIQMLKDDSPPRKILPIPKDVIYQQGNLVLRKVDEIPQDAAPVKVEPLPEGRIPLGGGHFLVPNDQE
ncbi:MAG: hypothetical protein JNL98_02105 [Bryobacterales bacterium]|nr:hypothetical protein [Bryobacterales bacterium]